MVLLAILSSPLGADAKGSTCYGTTANGRLAHGVKLPSDGPNFTSYGAVPELAGRTYVHRLVHEIVIEAYHMLETEQPGRVFKYAETGFEKGGPFRPHKTHRNGLSVDFMVPVIDGSGASVHLPTHALNKYGYDIEFDARGRFGEYRIDYEALAAHIVALDRVARSKGSGLWRVIFDPGLAPHLYATRYGEYLKKHVHIPRKRSWVRHDEHYHVDFAVDCEPL